MEEKNLQSNLTKEEKGVSQKLNKTRDGEAWGLGLALLSVIGLIIGVITFRKDKELRNFIKWWIAATVIYALIGLVVFGAISCGRSCSSWGRWA